VLGYVLYVNSLIALVCWTVQIDQRRLQAHLLDHRQNQLWLDNGTLMTLTFHLLEALIFLAERHLDPRDITAYNMIVEAGEGSRRGSRCSVLRGQGFVAKLADLGMTHRFLEYDDPVNRTEGKLRRKQ
jgi:hypothetical protein